MTERGPELNPSETVRDFFSRGPSVGLHLPDRWYGGRPMENQFELTFLADRPARLLIELDERILLVFTGEQISVESTTTDLLGTAGSPAIRIARFTQLIVDSRLYGGTDVKATIFREGAVHFVSSR